MSPPTTMNLFLFHIGGGGLYRLRSRTYSVPTCYCKEEGSVFTASIEFLIAALRVVLGPALNYSLPQVMHSIPRHHLKSSNKGCNSQRIYEGTAQRT